MFEKIATAAIVVLLLVVVYLVVDTTRVKRACMELGYRSAVPAFRMCVTRVNGTDIVVPLGDARALPRPGRQ